MDLNTKLKLLDCMIRDLPGAMNIHYFFVTDQISKGNLEVEYCPTGDMIGDFMTKPLQGKLFEKKRKLIMGHK